MRTTGGAASGDLSTAYNGAIIGLVIGTGVGVILGATMERTEVGALLCAFVGVGLGAVWDVIRIGSAHSDKSRYFTRPHTHPPDPPPIEDAVTRFVGRGEGYWGSR